MTFDQVKSLAIETVTSPGTAARGVLAIDVPRAAIFLGLALVAVLNGLYYGMLLPSLAQSGLIAATIANAPLLVTVFIFIVFTLMIFLTAKSGQFLGGTGTIEQVAKITVWLQMLRFAAQVAISILSFASPALGWLVSTAVGIWGIWILLSFVAEVHGFAIPKAIGTLAMTFIAMVVVMSVLSAAFGLTPPVPNGEI